MGEKLMTYDDRKTIPTDMNEDADLMGDDMTDQEREALQREMADASKLARQRAKKAM
jgi:hypothetical protein